MIEPLDVVIDLKNTRGWPKTERQSRWAHLYVVEGLTAYDAAIEVGYAGTTAKAKSYELSRKLQPYLAYLQRQKNAVAGVQLQVTAERVLGHLAAIAFANIGGYHQVVTLKGGVKRVVGKSPEELLPEQAPAVKGWTVVEHEGDEGKILDYQYVFQDQLKALFGLAKHLGLFNERIQLELRHEQVEQERIDYSRVPTDVLEASLESLRHVKDTLRRHQLAVPNDPPTKIEEGQPA